MFIQGRYNYTRRYEYFYFIILAIFFLLELVQNQRQKQCCWWILQNAAHQDKESRQPQILKVQKGTKKKKKEENKYNVKRWQTNKTDIVKSSSLFLITYSFHPCLFNGIDTIWNPLSLFELEEDKHRNSSE